MSRARFGWLLASLLAACTNAGGGGALGRIDPGSPTLSIPPQTIPNARRSPEPFPAVLHVPAGKGPYPVVILLHGCGGIGSNMRAWARRLNSWGYAAVILDSFGPRGVTTVCAPDRQSLVTPSDRAGDVLSAALYLQTVPELDASRIGVIGFSHGGGTAAWVTQQRYEVLHPHLLKASVDYYGACRAPQTHGTTPLLALAGEADDWGNPASTCRAFGAAMHPDQVFELHTYPGVYHSFDNPNQALARREGHLMGYDHASAEDSFQRVHAFLDRYLAGAGS